MEVGDKIRFFQFTVFLFVSAMMFSQNQEMADSIYVLYKNHKKEDTTRLKLLNGLATNLPDQDSVYKYSNELLVLSKKLNSSYYESFAYLHLGVSYRFRGELQRSLENLIASAKIAETKGYLDLLGSAYSEISTNYSSNNDFNNSHRYSNKAIAIFRENGKKERLAITLMNVGYEYYTINEMDTALMYYDEAEPIFEELGFDLGTAYTIGNRALILRKKGLLSEAKKDLFQAIEMLQPYGDLFGLSDFYIQLGNVFSDEGDIEEAINYSFNALDIAMSEDLKEQIKDASLLLSQLFAKQEQYKKALEYQTQYLAYKDSIQDSETTKQLADLRTEYEVGQKQVELDLANQQKSNRQNLAIALGAILFLSTVFFVYVYIGSQRRKRLYKKLQELDATKDKFFSIISHDLRGPINAFNGISSIIKGYLKKKAYDELEEMTDLIDKSAHSLSALLDNLLNWSVQQQGQVPYNPEPLHMSEVIDTTIEVFDSIAIAKEVTIINDVVDEVYCRGDKNTVLTIFRNLVGNAFKYTESGGTITISSKQVDDVVQITVKDTGVGMTKEMVNNLFELHAKKSTYGTKGEKGLGLGLQLVQEFVALNNGSVFVESEEGVGTQFTVSLPTVKIRKTNPEKRLQPVA